MLVGWVLTPDPMNTAKFTFICYNNVDLTRYRPIYVRYWRAVAMMNDRQAEQNQQPYRRPFHPWCQSSSGSKPLNDDEFKAELTNQVDIS